MKLIVSAILLVLNTFGFSQPSRRDIVDNRIKAIEISFYDGAGQKQFVQKNYYSVKSFDSLEFINDELNFVFKQAYDKNGRVKNLSRSDKKGFTDEIHIVEYNNDDTYTIEVIAHGAGTISFEKFNSKHDCIEEVLSSTDTFYFSSNRLGKIGKVSQKDSGNLVDIAITEFDENGFPLITKSLTGNPVIVRFRNNKQGLPTEIIQYQVNNSQEKLVTKLVYAYEFWK